ncbi:MAG: MerR family DNA-binding transcriptional regulator, partial [Micromonosporaceae bacterium]
MTAPLLTISAFARAVHLTPSALRYYHEAGLLPPAEVDARTGYRYYTPWNWPPRCGGSRP